jgi:predicted Rdx family selenoprotein
MSNCKYWNLTVKGMAFDPESGESFQLNGSGRLILERTREGRSPEEISSEVSRKFGVPYERALTDVLEFQVQLNSLSEAA